MRSLDNINLENSYAQDGKDFIFTDDDFKKISSKIYTLAGIVLRPEKKGMVYARLLKRIKELNIASFSDYLSYLNTNESQEVVHLINALTTNLTRFFRENHHFDHFSSVVLDEFYQTTQTTIDPKFRVWSSASSSGEEVYSIAMTILEAMASKRFSLKNVKILGTDIDTEMVKKANAGIYSSTDVANVPDVYKKYFTKIKENTFSINQPLRDIITFKQLNLLSEWPFQGLFDAVFCRNVVIYFDKETQRVLFDKIANILKPNGWLYIGHSESLFKVSDRFELIGQTIYRKVY